MRRCRDQSMYRSIRLRTEVADAIEAWVGRSVQAYDAGRAERWWEGERPTISDAIAELVRRAEAHRTRAKARKVRRAKLEGPGQP